MTVQSNVLKHEIDTLIEDLQEQNESFNFEDMYNRAKEIVEARDAKEVPNADDETKPAADKTKPVTDETKLEDSTTEESKAGDIKDGLKSDDIKEDVDVNSSEEECQPELISLFETNNMMHQDSVAVMALDLMEVNTLNSSAPIVDEVVKPQVETIQEEENTKAILAAPVQAKTADEKAADEFITTYLTSSQGNVYAQANSLNCKNIISGLQAWNQLSSTEKSAVNKKLRSEVGKTFQTLLKEAQSISYGSSVSTTSVYSYNYAVNTGTQNNIGLYAAVCAFMAIIVGIVIKKRHDSK